MGGTISNWPALHRALPQTARLPPWDCRDKAVRGAQTTVSVSGQRIFFNHYALDGIENTDPSFNSYLFLPLLDALQEFKVESGIFTAEYGHNMTQINVTTKSGTNQFHGSAFEFLRNSALDAKNFFDSPTRPIPPFKRNQFGAVLGGPVLIPKIVNGRNKLFFFFDYEGLRERKALTQPATVPPRTWIEGNFFRGSHPDLRSGHTHLQLHQ